MKKDNKINLKKRLIINSVSILFFFLGVWLLSNNWCKRESGGWFLGDKVLQKKLASGVEKWVTSEIEKKDYSTGSNKFDGEWYFGTYLMAGMGFGQIALEHPEEREKNVKLMELCIERLISTEVRTFDRDSWGEDPLESLSGTSGHAAYLGYLNLLLSLNRYLDKDSKYAGLNDQITEALIRRLNKSSLLLLWTYPYEVYPVDNCAVIASIGLYDLATGSDNQKLIEKWIEKCQNNYIDKETGLLYQCVNPGDGSHQDAPRGSGTALAVYFLSFLDSNLSKDLYMGLKENLYGNFLGFGAIKEYPANFSGRGDIDSGPLILDYSISATGFTIAGARIHNDKNVFSSLFGTGYLFGSPCDRGDKRDYIMGGPLGNAIMLAMLTAQKSE